MINDKKVMYDHLADKTNVNKWKSSTSLKKLMFLICQNTFQIIYLNLKNGWINLVSA